MKTQPTARTLSYQLAYNGLLKTRQMNAKERIKELKTLTSCPDWPDNPLQIFSIVERLRSQIKGTGMFAETIHQAIAEEPNYFKIAKYVQDKGKEDYGQVSLVVPTDLLNEIIAFEIPDKLLNP